MYVQQDLLHGLAVQGLAADLTMAAGAHRCRRISGRRTPCCSASLNGKRGVPTRWNGHKELSPWN